MADKYPSKRGYAIGKLQKFLALANLTKEFREACQNDADPTKGNSSIGSAFTWRDSILGQNFWYQVNREFAVYCTNGTVHHVYNL